MSEEKNVLENKIMVKANQHLLDMITGNLFIENRGEEFTNQVTGEKGVRAVPTALTLGELLARPVAEGIGANPEEKFTCAMLGGKLYDYRNLKDRKGWFDVSVEQLALIKKVVNAMQFGGTQQNQGVEISWLKASMLYLLDPASIEKEDERKFFDDRYDGLAEKLAVWELEHPTNVDLETKPKTESNLV